MRVCAGFGRPVRTIFAKVEEGDMTAGLNGCKATGTGPSSIAATQEPGGHPEKRWRNLIARLLDFLAVTPIASPSATPRRHCGGNHEKGWRNLITTFLAGVITALT